MRKIFLDCGAWCGNSVSVFREHYPDASDYEIYSFECGKKQLEKLKTVNNIQIIDKAVRVNDGHISFYLSRCESMTEGNTMFKKKSTGRIDRKHPIEVECIDFSKWIEDNFNEDDYIILKMNIEGAEYAVLNKMLRDNTIDYINKLYIQWHRKKINYPKLKHNRLVNSLEERNIKFYKWVISCREDGSAQHKYEEEFIQSVMDD